MLEIKPNKTIILDGETIESYNVNMEEFFMGCLDVEIKIDNQLTLIDFIDTISPLKSFINQYYVEEYETIKALVSGGIFSSFQSYISLNKKLENDNDFLYVNTTCEIIDCKEEKKQCVKNVKDIKFKFNEKIQDSDNLLKQTMKNKFTLLNIIGVVFIDLAYILRNEPILI